MDAFQLAQDALVFFQQVEPGLSAALKVGTTVGTVGTAAVQVLQKGKELVTYLIKRSSKTMPSGGPETLAGSPPAATKGDVAILVDVNRRMLPDVARFLDAQGIDADLVIVTNDTAYSTKIQFLDPAKPEEWELVVREFTTAMNAIKRAVGGARMHIFLSTPLPVAFGLGAVWGTVDLATVYHYQENRATGQSTYFPVMRVSRALREAA